MIPTLLLLAAGRGSRYGGPKQLERYGKWQHSLMEYGIFDAMRHGVARVVVVVSKNGMAAAEELLERAAKKVPIEFVVQDSKDAPSGVKIPDALEQSPGTAHAIFCARRQLDGPFTVINGDDFYAAEAWDVMAKLIRYQDPDNAAAVAYRLAATLSPNGAVSRGVCNIKDGKLLSLKEVRGIVAVDEKIRCEADEIALPPESAVSMNFFSFPQKITDLLAADAVGFFSFHGGGEWALPDAVSRMVEGNLMAVAVAVTRAPWFGITHRNDRQLVERALAKAIMSGYYPEKLW